MIKNVVFDLGGVVIGRDYEKYASEIAEFLFLQGDRPFPEYWKEFNRGIIGRREVAAAIAASTELSPNEAEAKLDRLMALFYEFPDTAELIAELHEGGYDMYVLSNMPAEFIEYASGHFDVFRFFKGMIVSCWEKMAKPDPRFYGLLEQRFGIVPSETLFVDDKPSNIKAADALGFHTCCFKQGRESCDMIREILKRHSK